MSEQIIERERKRRPHLAGYKDEREKANELGQSQRALREWRLRGLGPPWVRIGNQILYPDDAFERWVRSRIVHPVRECTA
jgi:Helix-turn-helix domain